MHARVTSLSGSPADVDGGVANFRENVVPFTHEQGGKGAILLLDRQTGSAIAITLWEDEQRSARARSEQTPCGQRPPRKWAQASARRSSDTKSPFSKPRTAPKDRGDARKHSAAPAAA
jgi:hypothetical protein